VGDLGTAIFIKVLKDETEGTDIETIKGDITQPIQLDEKTACKIANLWRPTKYIIDLHHIGTFSK
jgi:hypothetical protein